MRYVVYRHFGCRKVHNSLREVRLCAGHWVHRDEVETVVLEERGNDHD